MIFAIMLLQQMLSLGYRLFKRAQDPMYQGLGLGLFLATCSCAVANCFGDRWTYLEIMGLMWVLIGAAARADQLAGTAASTEWDEIDSPMHMAAHGAYH
jgi:putative inorganic carbon (HCO3(-)) transporter